jgi:hypothetical protein
VYFEDGNGTPEFGEALSGMKDYRHALSVFDGCNTLVSHNSNGTTQRASVSQMSFAPVGMHSHAYQVSLTIQGVQVGMDIVLAQVTPTVAAEFMIGDIGSPDTDQFQSLIASGVAKIRS